MKLINILKEIKNNKVKDNPTYEYGCVMLYVGFDELNKIHNKINKDDIYIDENDSSYGLEKEPHVTLLYGLHEGVSDRDIKDIVQKYTFSTVKAFNISLFKNEKFDVLKFDIEGDSLHECNKELSKLPNTNKFPKYHPHLTIAYLKPGMGDKYVYLWSKKEYFLPPTKIIYSKPNGDKLKINVRID